MPAVKPEQLTDEKLVEHIIDSDQESFAIIVERYQQPLLRYARSIVKDPDAAADVVQNSFIKSFRNLRSFKTNLKFSSWLYRITHNEAINFINKHKREFRPDNEDWFDGIASELKTQDEELQTLFDQQLVHSAMATMKDQYREPLYLYAFEAKSYKEISNILKIPTATVGTRIKRAKEQLKKQIRKEERS